MHRQLGTTSFADAPLPAKVGSNARLEQQNVALGWEQVAKALCDLHAASWGGPSCLPVPMETVESPAQDAHDPLGDDATVAAGY